MERRNISGLMVILMVFSVFRMFTSEQQVGYIGCYKDDPTGIGTSLRDENGQRVLEEIQRNNGSSCKQFCWSKNIRYAGTKRLYCICVKSIVNAVSSTSCTELCPGNRDEICGSIAGVSLYDTMYKPTQTTTKVTRALELTNLMTIKPAQGKLRRETESTLTTVTAVTRHSNLIETTTLGLIATKTEHPTTAGKVMLETEPTTDKRKLSTHTDVYIVKMAKSKHESKGHDRHSKRIYTDTDSENTNEKSLTAVYIIVPVVILISGATALIVYIILRRQRLKDAARDCGHTPVTGSAIVNAAFSGENTNRRNIPSNSSQYCDIDNTVQTDAEYTTIDTNPGNLPAVCDNYAHLQMQPGIVVKNFNYSHLDLEQEIANSRKTDQVYAHTPTRIPDDACAAAGYDTDVTYNRLKLSPVFNKDKEADIFGDQTSVYDHAVAGGDDPRVTDADYSHLNAIEMKDKNTCIQDFTGSNNDSDISYDHAYFILEPNSNTK